MSRLVVCEAKHMERLHVHLVRYLVSFLDYKDAFAARRVCSAWKEALDDEHQQHFLSARAALHLSYALFEQPRATPVERTYLPPRSPGAHAWTIQPTVKYVGRGYYANALPWGTRSVSTPYWSELLLRHERAANARLFASSRSRRVIDADLVRTQSAISPSTPCLYLRRCSLRILNGNCSANSSSVPGTISTATVHNGACMEEEPCSYFQSFAWTTNRDGTDCHHGRAWLVPDA